MKHNAMHRLVTPIVLGSSLLITPSLALASATPRLDDAQLDALTAGTNVHLSTGMPGQPSQTIGVTVPAVTPGNAANSPGSPFNSTTPGNAPQHYAGSNMGNPAGNQPHSSSFNGVVSNPKAVAQYDVAGFQQYQNHVVK
jgi:hypothetical protein